MTSPYVVFAESNIKGGVSAALGPKTLIVGPNGTGKSAVANTVELALTGRVSDILGRRDVAKEIELQALAPSRKGELLARTSGQMRYQLAFDRLEQTIHVITGPGIMRQGTCTLDDDGIEQRARLELGSRTPDPLRQFMDPAFLDHAVQRTDHGPSRPC